MKTNIFPDTDRTDSIRYFSSLRKTFNVIATDNRHKTERTCPPPSLPLLSQ